MSRSLTALVAELGLAGSGQHCHEQAELIADWLEQAEQQAEVACCIRLSSLANQGLYREALLLAQDKDWPAIGPWLALCEWHLGLGSALDRRLESLDDNENPQLREFARSMRSPEAQ